MNILIVDDDRFVVTALEKKINWNALGISQVFSAHSLLQAQRILRQETIDLLISDIEMPRGSGLDLLSWMRSENYKAVAVLLTNHADFYYAQKAIALQIFEYCLKPIEFDKLFLILQKAVSRRKEDLRTAVPEGLAKRRQLETEHFWHRLFHNGWEQSPYSDSEQFFLISVRCFPWILENGILCSVLDRMPDCNSKIKKLWLDCCSEKGFHPEIFLEYTPDHLQYFAVFPADLQTDTPNIFRPLCREFISRLQILCPVRIRCDISNPFCLTGFPEAISQLNALFSGLKVWSSHIFTPGDLTAQPPALPDAPLENLEASLKSEKKEEALSFCKQYLSSLAEHHLLNSRTLSDFLVDVSQAVHTFLKSHGILAHRLFQNQNFQKLQEHNTDSLDSAQLYLEYLFQCAFAHIRFTSSSVSVAETIKSYIDQNFAMDLSRNDLADLVFLHPDYAARIFRNQIGISLNNYMIQRRIEEAKRLLKTTGLPVNVIADKVGYGNYSYFTKLFKKETGYTPQEYRKL